MTNETNNKMATIRINPALLPKLKAQAALQCKTIAQYASELLAEKLGVKSE